MGVTIHYRGRLKSPDLVSSLTDEVEEICITNNWKYNILTDEIAETASEIGDVEVANVGFAFSRMSEMRGITFQPHPKSEPVSLIFDKEGVLVSFLGTMFNSLGKLRKHCFVKTQFAGVDAHIRIINLFVYLKKKYFKRMAIHDEGGYYPDNDLAGLEKRFGFIKSAIDTLNDIFEHGIGEHDTPEDVMEHIKRALSASFKGAQVHIIRIDANEMREKMKTLRDRNKDVEQNPAPHLEHEQDAHKDIENPSDTLDEGNPDSIKNGGQEDEKEKRHKKPGDSWEGFGGMFFGGFDPNTF